MRTPCTARCTLQPKQFGVLPGKLRARDTLIVSKLGRDAPDVLLAIIKTLAQLGVEVI